MNRDIAAALANLEQIKKYSIDAEECLNKIDQHKGRTTEKVHSALDALDKVKMIHESLLMMACDIRVYLHSELIKPKKPQVLLGFWRFDATEINVLNDTCKGSVKYMDKMVIIPKNKKGLTALEKAVKAAKDDLSEHISRSMIKSMKENLLIGSSSIAGEIMKLIRKKKDDVEIMSALTYYDFVCISPWSDENEASGEEELEVLRIIELCKKQNVLVIANNREKPYEMQGNIAFEVKKLYEHYEFLPKKTVEELLFTNPINIMQMLRDEHMLCVPEHLGE